MEHVAVSIQYFLGSLFFLLGNSQKSTSALSCQLMQGSAKLFLYFAYARSHSLFIFFASTLGKSSSSFIRTSFNGTIITVSTKMVYSLPCFLFVLFFFVFGRFCVSCGPAFSKQDKNSRALFKTRASMRRC